MSVVMGADDTDASDLNPVALVSAVLLAYTMRVVSPLTVLFGSDARYEFDWRKVRLSIHGESDDAGDPFERGRMVSSVHTIGMLAPIPLMMAVALVGSAVATVVGEFLVPVVGISTLAIWFVAVVNSIAAKWLPDAISVVDHTTEPKPDALDDLQQEFVDGDLTESELEQAVEEVIER